MFSIPWVHTPYNSTRPWSQRRRRRERNAQRPITACHTIRPVQDMSRGLSQGGQDPWFVCVCGFMSLMSHEAHDRSQKRLKVMEERGKKPDDGGVTVWPWFQVLIHLNTRISAGSTPNMSTCKKNTKTCLSLYECIWNTDCYIFEIVASFCANLRSKF